LPPSPPPLSLPQAAGSTLLEALRQQQVQQLVGGSALPTAFTLLRHFAAAATHPAQASPAAAAAAEPAADAAGSEALTGLEQLLLLPAIPLEQQEQQGQYRDLIVPVFDLQRQPVGSYTLGGDIFDVPIRKDILHRVVRWQLAKQQQGTHKTKTRSEVRGGGRKPRPQKGSGRSRQGTIRAPQW
jgi:large subunit ribosomal protein L4